MNWNWFKKIAKDKPKFWETYLSNFEDKERRNRYVVFDCESTGLDYKKDRILSIGAVAIVDNVIEVKDYFEVFVIQELFKPESVPIHGIMRNGNEDKIVEVEAIIRFLEYIKDATLVGHHVNFDIELINEALSKLDLGKIKNDYMDTDAMYQKLKHLPSEEHRSLDELCDIYKIRKSDRHTASGDAFITALLFLKLKKKLEI
jgi:DNA polymerase-3 subunit epsilon